jgi:hypothetical protein
MSLEQELRRALRRKDPPIGFDDRVVSKILAGETPRIPIVRSRWGRWSRASLPLAASLMLAFVGTYYMHEQNQRAAREAQAQTEQAAREVVLALQIASEKISAAQARVEEITRHDATNTR